MYLHEEDGTALFRRITEQFPGGQIAFDGYSGSMVRLVSRLLRTFGGGKVKLFWGVDDPHDLEKHIPQLHLVENFESLMMPELLRRLSTNWFRGTMYKGLGKLPYYRHLVRHLRYEFERKPVV